MWIANFSYTHDCILGNRCKEFNVSLQSIYLNHYTKKNKNFISAFHHISGEKENIQKFVNSLKKVKTISKIEFYENSLFTEDWTKGKPSEFFNPEMFLVKPVLMDFKGWEYWEVASFNRELINKFISNVEKHVLKFELHSITNKSLNEVYFPKLFPNLTQLQKEAIAIAIKEGYYESPKRTSLRALAGKFKCSLSTFQKHLQVAEKKVMPDLNSYLK